MVKAAVLAVSDGRNEMNRFLIAEQLRVDINDWGTVLNYVGLRVTDTRSTAASSSGAAVWPPGPIALGPVVLDAEEVSS